MLTGEPCRVRQLMTTCGRPVTLTVLRPAPTEANRAELLAASHRWRAEAKALPATSDGKHRAFFASDVAFLAGSAVPTPLANHFILAAQDEAGTLRGLALYRLEERGVWELDLLTTDPENQGGNPNPCPIRGIGSEMLGTIAADMVARQCSSVELEPLDPAAERFWRARGFHNSTKPLHLTCPEMQALALRFANSPHDDPSAGDAPYCDDKVARRAISLHVGR